MLNSSDGIFQEQLQIIFFLDEFWAAEDRLVVIQSVVVFVLVLHVTKFVFSGYSYFE